MSEQFPAPKRAKEERREYFRSLSPEHRDWDIRTLRAPTLEGLLPDSDVRLAHADHPDLLTDWGRQAIRFANKAFLEGDADVRCHLWNQFGLLFRLRTLFYPAVLGLADECDPAFMAFLNADSDYAAGFAEDCHESCDLANPPLFGFGLSLVPTSFLEKGTDEDKIPYRPGEMDGFQELFGRPQTKDNIREALESWQCDGLSFEIRQDRGADRLSGDLYGFIALKKDRACLLGDDYDLPKPVRADTNLEAMVFVYARYRNQTIEQRALRLLTRAAKKGVLTHYTGTEYDNVLVLQKLVPASVKAYLPVKHPIAQLYEQAGYHVEGFLKSAFMDALTGPKDLIVLRYNGVIRKADAAAK